MHRLLVHAEALEREVADLPRDAARHLKVLRPKPGEEIELFDGCGRTRRYRWNAARGVLDAAKSYENYSGLADDMDSAVRFIWRTDAIQP